MAVTDWNAKSLTPDPRASSVEDLSGMVKGMVPSSMANNGPVTVDAAGSAPGSESISVHELSIEMAGRLPMPIEGGPQVPVASPRPKGRGPSHAGSVS